MNIKKRMTALLMAAAFFTLPAFSVQAADAPPSATGEQAWEEPDDIGNPAYTDYVKGFTKHYREKELVEIIGGGLKHIYSNPALYELEQPDGTRYFVRSGLQLDVCLISESELPCPIEEINRFLSDSGFDAWYEKTYDNKYTLEENCDTMEESYDLWILLCRKYGFKITLHGTYISGERPRFMKNKDYGLIYQQNDDRIICHRVSADGSVDTSHAAEDVISIAEFAKITPNTENTEGTDDIGNEAYTAYVSGLEKHPYEEKLLKYSNYDLKHIYLTDKTEMLFSDDTNVLLEYETNYGTRAFKMGTVDYLLSVSKKGTKKGYSIDDIYIYLLESGSDISYTQTGSTFVLSLDNGAVFDPERRKEIIELCEKFGFEISTKSGWLNFVDFDRNCDYGYCCYEVNYRPTDFRLYKDGTVKTTVKPAPATAQDGTDEIYNPSYTAYVNKLKKHPNDKELVKLLGGVIRHIYDGVIESELPDGSRIFEKGDIYYDLAIDSGGTINGHTVDEINQYLEDMGFESRYMEYEDGYALFEDSADTKDSLRLEEMHLMLCMKFGFGVEAEKERSFDMPRFNPNSKYGICNEAPGSSIKEYRLYADGSKGYPDGTVIYPEKPEETIPMTDNPDSNPLSGDANLDGIVNVRDCALIASAIANKSADSLPASADFNGDGKVNIRDAAAIANYLTNKT